MLNQNFRNLEIIILNNDLFDETLDIIRKLKSKGYKIEIIVYGKALLIYS